MSTVTIQLGQCGNQVGGELFSCMAKERPREFFREGDGKKARYTARAVLIDMEPKAILSTLTTSKRNLQDWEYERDASFWQHTGSANNWSHGYAVHGPRTRDKILETTRKQVERCESFSGFLMLSSLAGGTGSGLGAYTSELMRDVYPKSLIINQVVWPYTSGDVIVQGYNSILTLSHLTRVSDGIIVFQNDHLNQTAKRLLTKRSPSFKDLNQLIARSMGSVMVPCYRVDNKLSTSWRDRVSHLFSHCGYKFSTVCRIPQSSASAKEFNSYTWKYLLKHLNQMQISGSYMEEKINWSVALRRGSPVMRSVASFITLRGQDSYTAAMGEEFTHPSMYTRWAFDPYLKCYSKIPFDNNHRSAAVWMNSQAIVKPLDRLVDGAWQKFTSNAYVHHYAKHGIAQENFERGFALLEQVISDYKKL
ncbi:hypothetical protein AAMO2058_001741400 [Amorphochlora amoebiformis]